MINILCEEIKRHWLAGDHSFESSVTFRESAIKVNFENFKDDADTIYVVAMELSRKDGHRAQQDVAMGTKEVLNKLMNGPEYSQTVAGRLDTLHEAIEEMYD